MQRAINKIKVKLAEIINLKDSSDQIIAKLKQEDFINYVLNDNSFGEIVKKYSNGWFLGDVNINSLDEKAFLGYLYSCLEFYFHTRKGQLSGVLDILVYFRKILAKVDPDKYKNAFIDYADLFNNELDVDKEDKEFVKIHDLVINELNASTSEIDSQLYRLLRNVTEGEMFYDPTGNNISDIRLYMNRKYKEVLDRSKPLYKRIQSLYMKHGGHNNVQSLHLMDDIELVEVETINSLFDSFVIKLNGKDFNDKFKRDVDSVSLLIEVRDYSNALKLLLIFYEELFRKEILKRDTFSLTLPNLIEIASTKEYGYKTTEIPFGTFTVVELRNAVLHGMIEHKVNNSIFYASSLKYMLKELTLLLTITN